MSVFSKIFIVINLGLTLLLTGVMGTLLAQKADHLVNYTEEHRTYRETSSTLRMDKKAGNEAVAALTTRCDEEGGRAKKEGETFNRHSEERKTKSAQLSGREKSKNELYTRIKELNKTNNDLNDQVKTLVTQRNEANSTKNREVQAMNRAINRLDEVKDDVASANAAMANVKEMQKAFLAQKLDLENLIAAARRRGIDVEKAARDIANRAKKIQGVISNVNPEVFLVMLDIGKNDGVKEDMVFTVYRGAKYICKVKVQKVLDGQASALIMQDFLVPGRNIKTGDKVRNLD